MTELIQTLIVDDEERVRFFLNRTLHKAGYTVTEAASGEDALDRLRDVRFDLVVLDLKLGGKVDGLRVLEAIRWRWPETVVVILTAHGSLESAMAAIHEGVDGYLLKPAEPDEVRRVVQDALARRRLLAAQSSARQQPDRQPALDQEHTVLQCGRLRLDRYKHQVTLDGHPLELTPGEFKLLAHLMQHSQRVFSFQELVQVVQEYDSPNQQEAREIIKWYIYRLRRKVEADPSDPKYILNVRGVGYKLGDGAHPT